MILVSRHFFGRCPLTITWMSSFKEGHYKLCLVGQPFDTLKNVCQHFSQEGSLNFPLAISVGSFIIDLETSMTFVNGNKGKKC